MVYPCSKQVLCKEIGEHKFITYELDYPAKKEDFLKYIIPVLKEEYGLGITLEEKIRNISSNRKKNIEKFMAKYVDSQIQINHILKLFKPIQVVN